MDGRILAIVAALIITGAGAVTAVVVLEPLDVESDYNLYEKVAGGDLKEDLFYSYDRQSDSYTHYKSLNVRSVNSGVVTTYKTEREVMVNVAKDFDLEDFMDTLFNFTDEDEVPEGITVTSETVPATPYHVWTIDGYGEIETGSSFTSRQSMYCEFTDFQITIDYDTEEVTGILGEVNFGGERSKTVPNQYYSYNDVTYKFANVLGAQSFTVTGEVTFEGTCIYSSVSDFDSELETFYAPYSATKETDDEYVYAGCECTKYLLDGVATMTNTVYSNTTVFLTESGYLIKLYGVINEEKVTIDTEIYYIE